MSPSPDAVGAVTGPPPDFIIIGMMKAGTTSLFRWLQAHPQVASGGAKEPNFFWKPSNFPGGVVDEGLLAQYRSQLGAGEGLLTGEASVRYTYAERGRDVAERIAAVAPEVRLVCVVREPVARMRSHYRYWVRRAVEREPFVDAVSAAGNAYVARSSYATALEPFIDTFGAGQLLVVGLEELDAADQSGWLAVLGHLGLDEVPRPVEAHNVTAQAPSFSPLARRLHLRGWLNKAKAVPGPVRSVGRRILMRGGSSVDRLLASAEAPVPGEVAAVLDAEAERMCEMLGWPSAPW